MPHLGAIMDSLDITIIGGGVIGLATAYFLGQQYPHKTIALLEKNKRVGEEQSGRNSGVIHSGYLYTPGSNKARLCPQGNRLLKEFSSQHGVHCAELPKIVLASTPQDFANIKFYYQRGKANGVELEKISREEIKKMEPNVESQGGLYIPNTGIIDAASYLKTLEGLIKRQNAALLKETKVVGIIAGEKHFTIEAEQQQERYSFQTESVINAAGLYADSIGRMINPEFPYVIKPLRGEYMKFNRNSKLELWVNNTNIYPVPEPIPGMYDQWEHPQMMVGIHLTPTFSLDAQGEAIIGNSILVGPLGRPVDDKQDCTHNLHGPEKFCQPLQKILPGIKTEDLHPSDAGIQAKIEGYDDIVLEHDRRYPKAFHAIAPSPGLTVSLVIGEKITEEFKRFK